MTKQSSMRNVSAKFLIALITWFAVGSSYPTEFGGMAGLDFAQPILDHFFLSKWKQEGDLKWIRAWGQGSPWLGTNGINQASVLGWAPETTRLSGGKDLPDNLLALYWHCRTNLSIQSGITHTWEVWNEPDFKFVRDNPDRMAAVIKAAFWGIKAANSNAIVLMPSLAFSPNKYGIALAENNIYPYTEGYNCHFYGWAHDFLPSLKLHQKFMKDRGWHLPMWVSEIGYFQMLLKDSRNPRDLARQQAFHERTASSAYVAGVDYYMPFVLTPLNEEGYDLSLSTPTFSARPALDSYLRLTRQLPQSRPLYQIFHRPTKTEIGLVLSEAKGGWWTVLWSPFRWKDFDLPSDAEQFPSKSRSKQEPEQSTDLQLHFKFPKSIESVAVGLNAITSENVPLFRTFTVSADKNLHLRTSATRFRIQDCEWRPINFRPTTYPPSFRSTEMISAYGTNHISLEDQNIGIKGGEWLTHLSSRHAIPIPSAVVVQIDYDISAFTSDKPSQTYQYTDGSELKAKLNLYNFSETEQAGKWSFSLSHGSIVSVGSTDNVKTLGSINFPKEKIDADVTLAPLSKTSVKITFQTKEQRRSHTSGKSFSALLNFRNPDIPERTKVTAEWKGRSGIYDISTSLVQSTPSLKGLKIFPLPVDWRPAPHAPVTWSKKFLNSNTIQLTAHGTNAPGRMRSIFLKIPEDIILQEDDRLLFQIRLTTPNKNSYFRVNLITPEKEVFRYTENLSFGDNFSEIDFRVGDSTPFFWSRVGKDYNVPVRRFRYIRISAGNLAPEDRLEIRNAKIGRNLNTSKIQRFFRRFAHRTSITN